MLLSWPQLQAKSMPNCTNRVYSEMQNLHQYPLKQLVKLRFEQGLQKVRVFVPYRKDLMKSANHIVQQRQLAETSHSIYESKISANRIRCASRMAIPILPMNPFCLSRHRRFQILVCRIERGNPPIDKQA